MPQGGFVDSSRCVMNPWLLAAVSATAAGPVSQPSEVSKAAKQSYR